MLSDKLFTFFHYQIVFCELLLQMFTFGKLFFCLIYDAFFSFLF